MTTLQFKIGILTQATMMNTNLPGKFLLEIKDKNLLTYHIERLQKTGFDLAIATTNNAADDVIETFATNNHIKCFRGSEDHILSCFYHTATKFNFDIIVRVTSDCPFIDPHLIRNSIEKYLRFNNERLYMSNVIDRTFAHGFDFEIFSYTLLKEAYENTREISDINHVTPYIQKNISGKTEFYEIKQSENHSHLHININTMKDLVLVKTLIEDYNAAELPYNAIEEILLRQTILEL